MDDATNNDQTMNPTDEGTVTSEEETPAEAEEASEETSEKTSE
jgi:hypothetical protein